MSTNGSGPASAQAPDYSGASLKKMRGRPKGSKSKKSRDLIAVMHKIAEAAKPISVRGIAYKLFTAGLIPCMGLFESSRVTHFFHRRVLGSISPGLILTASSTMMQSG